MPDVGENLRAVEARVARAARQSGRDPATIRLIAVSKTFDAAAIAPALAAGQRDFGENRVQEAQGKWPALRAAHPQTRLQLIGPLQTNKAADAVALFDAIHSLDRDKLAAALAAEMARQGRSVACFVQVNTGAEAQKSGIDAADVGAFVGRCRDTHGLIIEGLMCLPPIEADPAPHFALLARLAEPLGLTSLSMGMSSDFETAIAHGATHIRVGSAIFGERG